MIKTEEEVANVPMGDDDPSQSVGGEATTTTESAPPQPQPAVVADVIDNDPLPRAPELLYANSTEEKKLYWDRSHYDSPESQMKALAKSSTLYIGNMAFSTRSHNVLSHFSQIGPVRKVVMGQDRFHHTPCGFGFVEYVHREDALLSISNLSSTKLDGRIIRVELDAGFQSGRQYGRGKSGGQVRDDKRKGQIDPERNNKRQRTQNWTPPEQVGGGAGAAGPDGGIIPAPAGGDISNNDATQPQGDAAMGEQESSSRFRDES
ncbi:MAG: nuclear cap-binding protein subunit 2 [Bacillariaceae sp.]|jgi:nuclear cap-binding protein subunit 2